MVVCPHTLRASGSPASAQGASEVLFLLVKKKTECPRAIRPRVQWSPYLIRRPLNAGRRNSKDRLQTRLNRCASKGVRGKAFPPNGALCAPGVRGVARRRRAGEPRIKRRTRIDTDKHERTLPELAAYLQRIWKIPAETGASSIEVAPVFRSIPISPTPAIRSGAPASAISRRYAFAAGLTAIKKRSPSSSRS